MRSGYLYITLIIALLSAGCISTRDSGTQATNSPHWMKTAAGPRAVEAGCAMCVYKMKDVFDCLLAVKIDGKSYLVTGSDIDDHGDAHAPDGLCHTARPAQASGVIENGRFVANEFRLDP